MMNLSISVASEVGLHMKGINQIAKSLMRIEKNQTELEMIKVIRCSSKVLTCNIGDLMDLSILQTKRIKPRLGPCNIKDICLEVIQMMGIIANMKQVEIYFYLGKNLPETVITDSNRIQQMILNLIGNAIDRSNKGSVRLRVVYHRRLQQLKVEVHDNQKLMG